MTLRPLIAALAVAALTSSAMARSGLQPVPVTLPNPVTPVPFGEEHAGDCEEVYINETGQTGFYFPAGAGVEVGDDLHTIATSDWPLCAFDFGYALPTAGTTDAVVTLYRNDGADTGFGAVLAGPFRILGLPGEGAYGFHVEVPSGIVGPDVWMGVAFSNDDAGLLTFDPPSIGVSHDVDAVDGVVYVSAYGGAPNASYFLGAYASRPTGTQSATWGQVKSFYR
jgi:hypothetical protein